MKKKIPEIRESKEELKQRLKTEKTARSQQRLQMVYLYQFQIEVRHKRSRSSPVRPEPSRRATLLRRIHPSTGSGRTGCSFMEHFNLELVLLKSGGAKGYKEGIYLQIPRMFNCRLDIGIPPLRDAYYGLSWTPQSKVFAVTVGLGRVGHRQRTRHRLGYGVSHSEAGARADGDQGFRLLETGSEHAESLVS